MSYILSRGSSSSSKAKKGRPPLSPPPPRRPQQPHRPAGMAFSTSPAAAAAAGSVGGGNHGDQVAPIQIKMPVEPAGDEPGGVVVPANFMEKVLVDLKILEDVQRREQQQQEQPSVPPAVAHSISDVDVEEDDPFPAALNGTGTTTTPVPPIDAVAAKDDGSLTDVVDNGRAAVSCTTTGGSSSNQDKTTSKKRKAVDAADQVNQQKEEDKKEEQKKTKETVWCWVKIYLGPNDRTLGVADFVGNVYQIKKAVKKECPLALAHCDTAFLQVYAPGTSVPPPPSMELDEKAVVALDADQAIDPHGTSATTKRGGRGPIIVIAPMS